MSSNLTFFVGNRNPSITETITSNGSAVDLSSSTVKFQARTVGATALLVDAAVSNSPDATGVVRYDWAAADITTGGILASAKQALVWWRVTTSGKTQDMAEALIEIRDHSAGNSYVELEQFKSTAELKGQTFADLDIQAALQAASRGVDDACGRRFSLDADATSVRYYTPDSARILPVDDLVVITSVAIDRGGDGTFEETLTVNTDYVAEPLNAASDARPWEWLRIRSTQSTGWPCGVERSVKVTGQFGWSAVPAQVKTATSILAAKLLVRMRQAPLGFQIAGGLDATVVARIARTDPDVYWLLADLDRKRPFV